MRASVIRSPVARVPLFLSLPNFDFICDLLLNRRTAIWSLFVKHTMENCCHTTKKHTKQNNHNKNKQTKNNRTIKKLLDTYVDYLGIQKSLSNYGLKQVQF